MIDRTGGAAEAFESVFRDDFTAYPPGPFSEPYSAEGEVHYLDRTIDQGPWSEICIHYSFPKFGVRWGITEEQGRRGLRQFGHNREFRRTWKYLVKRHLLGQRVPELLFYPALAVGNLDWNEYRVTVRLRQDSTEEFSGLLFGIEHSRRHFAFGVSGGRAVLFRRDQEAVHVLARRRIRQSPGQTLALEVQVDAGRFRASVDGERLFDVPARDYVGGKAGVAANVPTTFESFEVLMRPPAREKAEAAGAARTRAAAEIRQRYPGMRRDARIVLPVRPSGRSLRFGDLAGTGRNDILIAQGSEKHGRDNYNALTCLTAMDVEGRVLWQRGEANETELRLCSDLPVQIYDIDGDGRNEVICAMDFSLQILDGRTGELKKSAPTPLAVPPLNVFERTLGDSIQIVNVRGGDRPRDILLKDRHAKIWMFDDQLSPLWEYHYAHGELGHFPFAVDINGDGRDELLVGSALVSASGGAMWDLKLKDHADAIAVFGKGAAAAVAIAASDEGFLFCGIDGRISRRLLLGHMQTVTLARLLPDEPDYQIATNTYWGNPGIIYVLDLAGRVLTAFQPSTLGSPIMPVNWLGTNQAFLLLSAAPNETGGLYDGLGRQAVAFPDDGHPLLCYDAADLDGDGVDELLCWDHHELWVYHVDRPAASGGARQMRRYPPQHSASNYVACMLTEA